MITELFLKGRLRHELSKGEREALENAIDERIRLEPRQPLIKRGDKVNRSYYLIDGFMARYLSDKSGHRQSVGLQVPGDFVDLHSFPMKRLDHDAASVGPVEVAAFRHDVLSELVAERPHLARVLWFSTLLDAAIHREWVFRLGRLNAEGRIAHLIAELMQRLEFVGKYDGGRLQTPLNQHDFAEACGITPVHANRTFRQLRERGLIDNRDQDGTEIRILDRHALEHLGEFKGDYLYGSGELELRDPYGSETS